MDETETDEDDGGFSYMLEFAAAKCLGCGEAGEPGPCAKCGQEIGATEERLPSTEARIAALGPMAERIDRLSLGFDQVPPGHIPITSDQMTTAITDGDVFGLIQEMPRLGHELGTLDLNDPKVVGQGLRRLTLHKVERVEELLATCQLLGRFAPEGPAGELRDLSIKSGAYGASLLQRTVETLVAPDVGSARAAQARLQELLDSFPYGDQISAALEQVPEWSGPDPDARAALVLGRPGRYSDDFGLPDLRRVFAAFADEEQPFEAIAARARAYFAHLLDPDTPPEIGLEAMLILPALGLATLDRPLLGHRLSEQTHQLLAAAWDKDAEATQRLIDRTGDEGRLVLAAAGRIETGFRMLGLAEAQGLIDDQAVLKTVMEAYLDLAEGAFRTYGWLARDLAAIVANRPPGSEDASPTLANLVDQLAAAGDPSCLALAEAVDPKLRNARGHSQYSWNQDTGQIEDLRTGNVWSPEDLERTMLALVSVVLGADAGYLCFLASGQAELTLPEWISSGQTAEANTLMAHISFGGFGFEVLEVRDAGATVVISRPEVIDTVRLLSPTAGLAGVLKDLERLRVLDPDGDVLLDIDPETVRGALKAP
ncbi:MAG TPA: hypothetical protein VE078_19740, partial [Thermoanaerobaculia bacterium]|nr:hypothetical protein [Thermoanaerobaculia bacterium]